MDINKKTRAELKNYFKKNAVPTEGNFADLIDAAVNQKDDGLLKPAGEPLSLEASLDTKTAIRFYETFTGNTTPAWVLSLKEPVSQQSAFVLSDGNGNTRLSLGQSGALSVTSLTTTGTATAGGLLSANAGINVTGAALNVGTGAASAQPLNVWGALTANSTATFTGLITAGGGLIVPAGKTLTVSGALAGPATSNGLTVNGNLSVTGGGVINAGPISATGLITASGGLTTGTATAGGLLSANAGINVTGAALNVGTGAANAQPLNVWGALTANSTATFTGLITASGGLIVPAGTTLTVSGALSAGPINASGLITASGGLTVPLGQPLTVGGTLNVGDIITNGLYAEGIIAANSHVGISEDVFQVSTNEFLVSANLIELSGGGGSQLSVSGSDIELRGEIVSLMPVGTRNGLRLDANLYQYAQAPSIPATVAFNTGITIQAWIFLYSCSQNARIVDFSNGPASDNIIFFVYEDGSLGAQVYRGSTSGPPLKSTSHLPLGHWIHVALTIDGAGMMMLWQMGTPVGFSAASSANVPNAVQRNNNYLGKSASGNEPYWNGLLSQVSVWTGVRPVTMTPPAGNAAGLVAYWGPPSDACTNTGHIGNLSVYNSPEVVAIYNWGQGVIINQEAWVSPKLESLWSPYGNGYNPPAFFKDSFGVVHLRGRVQIGGGGAQQIFTLPMGYRPQYREVVIGVTDGVAGCIDIKSSGEVWPVSGIWNFVSLDGITFRAA